eukprot:jgi/Bigna1/73379/fgenesh1_pg.24_\
MSNNLQPESNATAGTANTQDDDSIFFCSTAITVGTQNDEPMFYGNENILSSVNSQTDASEDVLPVQPSYSGFSHQQPSCFDTDDFFGISLSGEDQKMDPESLTSPPIHSLPPLDESKCDRKTESISDPSQECNPFGAAGTTMAADIPALIVMGSSSRFETKETKEAISSIQPRRRRRRRKRKGCANCVTAKRRCSAVDDQKFPCNRCIADNCPELCVGPYDPERDIYFNMRLERTGSTRRLRDNDLALRQNKCRKIVRRGGKREGLRCTRPYGHGGRCA